MAIEMVDLPNKQWVIFRSYVGFPEGKSYDCVHTEYGGFENWG